MSAPTVSVVVPCYNGGEFLDGLLASLAAQSFRDFEIIIVDDGSTDPATAKKLASLPPDIRVIQQDNRGLPEARNIGYRAARAEFVLPLDCDDRIEPKFLSEAITLLSKAPADVAFVFSHMRLFGAINGILPRNFNCYDQLFLNRLPYCLLLRKFVWEAIGGYDETMRDGYEDWEFSIRLALAGFNGIEIAEPLFAYFVSSKGMLMSRSARMHGTLWRRILKRHRDSYRFKNLRKMYRQGAGNRNRFGLMTGLMLVWGGRVLPERLISVLFYLALRTVHRLRFPEESDFCSFLKGESGFQ